MPGDPSPKASSGGIIAYNHDSARGWNDPPTFAFANTATTNKPKLDLRKRVSHQQALHGVQAPSQRTCNTNNRDDVVNGVSGLNLNGIKQPLYKLPPVTTAPLGTDILNPPIPAAFTRSISTPTFSSKMVNTGVAAASTLAPPSPGTLHARSSNDLSGSLGQPLFDLKDHSFEPVRTAHSIRSTAEIGDHLDLQEIHASPHIFHPISPPLATASSLQSYQGASPAVSHLGHATPLQILPYQPLVGLVTQPSCPVQGQSPIPPTVATEGGGVTNHPLQGQSMTPPLLPGVNVLHGGSLSAGSTPRSTSPSSQETNGDSMSIVDDNEGLKITMDALQDVINKLQDTLEKRVADDIARRLQVMSQNWMNGKLSQGVKSRMIKLAKALDNGDSEEAHHIHISLMVDFVAEVNQWMVAVKKLINLVRSSDAFPAQS